MFTVFLDSLEKANATDFERIDAIRKYFARKIDMGFSLDSLSYNYHRIPFEDISPFESMELFERNQLTAQCGLSSYILTRLYQYAGYEAYLYECGFDDTMARHQFVLVRLNGSLVVQDPFYNITVKDSNNAPKDFHRLVSEIKAGDFSNIRVVHESVSTEFWADSMEQMTALFETFNVNDEFKQMLIDGMTPEQNRLKIMLERNYETFTGHSLEAMKPFLEAEGFPENYLSIYLSPLQVKNNRGEEDDVMKKQIDDIIEGVAEPERQ